MAWALALVVVIGVGLPLAAWAVTRRLPPPRAASRLGVGYDAIDRWLLDRYQLPPLDRWRVRDAVFQGREVNDVTLARAAHGLATRVLTGGFGMLRLSQVVGWTNLIMTIDMPGTGLAKFAPVTPARGALFSARRRLGMREGSEPPPGIAEEELYRR